MGNHGQVANHRRCWIYWQQVSKIASNDGWEVCILDNLSTGLRSNAESLEAKGVKVHR